MMNTADIAYSMPLVTIVTICYNNPAELVATLTSTRNIPEHLIERVVVDGSSNNECIEAVDELGLTIHHYVKERDKGIYDAMNKGTKLATGRALLMLNSGDTLCDASSFSRMIQKNSSILSSHIIYGETTDLINGKEIPRPSLIEVGEREIRRGLLPSHQSILIPRTFAQSEPYRLDLGSSADTFFLRSAFRALPSKNVRQTISLFTYGGHSNTTLPLREAIRAYRHFCAARHLTFVERLAALSRFVARSIIGKVAGQHRHQALQERRAIIKSRSAK